MSSTPLKLSLTQLPRSTFTSENLPGLIRDGLDLVCSVPSDSGAAHEPSALDLKWQLAKSDADIKVFNSTYEGERWTTRVTNAEIPYDLVRKGLGDGKLEAEKEYFSKPEDAMEILSTETFDDGKIQLEDIHKLLHLQAFSAREFLQAVISHDLPPLSGGLRQFIVISMPLIGESRSESAVFGRYVSVDYVQELENGRVEIFLVLCSDAGGSIPRWIQNMAMTGQVFGDGRLFLNYLVKENHMEKNEENEENEDNKDNKENKENKESENVPS